RRKYIKLQTYENKSVKNRHQLFGSHLLPLSNSVQVYPVPADLEKQTPVLHPTYLHLCTIVRFSPPPQSGQRIHASGKVDTSVVAEDKDRNSPRQSISDFSANRFDAH